MLPYGLGKQIQNSPPFKVLLEAIFSEMIQTNNVSIFRQGNCTMDILYLYLSKSFVLSNCSRNPMKTRPYVMIHT